MTELSSPPSYSDMAIATPGYFGTMGIPVLKGRDFSEWDDARAPLVLVVNEAFARKYFPGEEVIGKRIQPGAHSGEGPTMREIVGVVGNAKQVALSTEPDPICYFPYKQLPWGIGTIVLRTAVPPLEVRSAVALLLTGAGLYGVLSHAVARRRAEIGVRIALGAGRREVLSPVFRQAMQLVAAGLILGVTIATAGGRLLGTTVFGIRPGNPVVLVGACCALAIIGMAAAYVPAARAASVDPMRALRSE